MKIILSPAKKMQVDTDTLPPLTVPVYLDRAEEILAWLRGLSDGELKRLWACSDKIASENARRIREADLRAPLQTPAVLAYDGIAYQYMAPAVFEDGQYEYVQEHLRILSGFYGVLKPMDGVVPYRLEMQSKARVGGVKDLYAYWGSALYEGVTRDGEDLIVDLASKEYSDCITRYLTPSVRCVTCVFGELSGGRVIQKGVYAKMARGEMVRFMAEKGIEDPEELKGFDRLGYRFSEERSEADTLVFLKE